MTDPVRSTLRWRPGADLGSIDPRATPGVQDRERAERETADRGKRLVDLQERLWAEGTRSLLLILQGMDTSGKGGTISKVVAGMNPLGVDAVAFKKPTEEELAHHFLWRIEGALPGAGDLVVFDRSHYEDVLVVRVHDLVPEATWRGRYDEIVAFEERVHRAQTTIVKVMLHLSFDEQRERLLARLETPEKRWKFNEQDIEERQHWAEYMAAYREAMDRCDRDEAPWYVVPADRKWYRNWAVGAILEETLLALDPRYPIPDLDVEGLKARLHPPA